MSRRRIRHSKKDPAHDPRTVDVDTLRRVVRDNALRRLALLGINPQDLAVTTGEAYLNEAPDDTHAR